MVSLNTIQTVPDIMVTDVDEIKAEQVMTSVDDPGGRFLSTTGEESSFSSSTNRRIQHIRRG